MVPFTIPWQIGPARHNLVVAVKATFAIIDRRPAALCEEQPPPMGDVRFDGAETASLHYASDFAIHKPKADVTMVGHAYPGSSPGVALVTLQIGRLHRSIAVFGDRTWGTLGAQSKPAAFDRLPLRWERAMGGPLSEANPIGRGFKTGILLPNLERREALVQSARDVPAPACFAPVPQEWKSRMSKLGSFGGAWRKERWPFFPQDFDFSFFNAAPPEQQVPYLRGDEAFSIQGVRPDHAVLAGQLPAIVPRAFAYMSQDAGGAFAEVGLNLDTVWFDTDAARIALVWRGMVNVRDDEASDIAALFVTTSSVGEVLDSPKAFDRFVVVGSDAQLWDPPPIAPVPDAPTLPIAPSTGAPAAQPATRMQVVAWLARKESLAGRDLTGVDLSGLDLSGADLGGAILKHAVLQGAQVRGANFAHAVLARADARGVAFDACEMSDADLDGALLVKATFRGAKLSGASFAHADGSDAVFAQTDATGAVFARAVVRRAVFDGAMLAKADFTGARVHEACFSAAKLDDARFYDAEGEHCAFDGASMQRARMDGAVLRGSNFGKADAQESIWERADVTESSFHSAKVGRASFTKAKLVRCVMSALEGKGASFRKADLRQASLLKANLMHANFEGADLTDADLRGANLYQVAAWRAKLAGTKLELAITDGSNLG